MILDFLYKVFLENKNKLFLIDDDYRYTYGDLLNTLESSRDNIDKLQINDGSVVYLSGNYDVTSISYLISLLNKNMIVIPLATESAVKKEKIKKIVNIDWEITISDKADILKNDNISIPIELILSLRKNKTGGIILFSSGITGEIKGAVHDFSKLSMKYRIRRKNLRTLTFLLFDHIGGLDTLFYSLSNGSTIVTTKSRDPRMICKLIENHQVEVLPVTPTFLNLLLISGAYKDYNLNSLKYITYGTEVMPESTLKKCNEVFPNLVMLQKYGTTEVGTLRSKSKSSESLWVKVGGEGFETRVVNGFLEIKADSAMLGYLNAPSPFTGDGWFMTGDRVEVDGEFIRILGRKSEIINVGGEKVYPAEVESVILELEGIKNVIVYGEEHPIMGEIVCAEVSLTQEFKQGEIKNKIKSHCRTQLQSYKVPVKIKFTSETLISERFKKTRNRNA